jgi:type I restriction enzyme S subunit
MAGMNKSQAYPEYTCISTPGLVQLPSQWEIKQIKYLLKNGSEGTKIGPFGSALKLEDMVDDGVRVYGQENVIKRDFALGKRRISFNKFNEMRVYEVVHGDILITMMGTSGKCEIMPRDAEKGIIDSHLIRARVNKNLISPAFFKLLVDESPEIKHQIKIQGKGSIMLGLNSGIIRGLYLPLPNITEQKVILLFLDYEHLKINNLIEKQQQLIELLKEKRQAVISHAVTKGLNPDVPIKDSGVEWFGDVPSHWLKTIIKHIAKINPLKTKIAPDLMKKECSFIPMENLKLNKIILDEHRVIKDVYNSYTYFEDKDILMAKVTPCFENKNIAIAKNLFNGIGFGTTEIYVIRCNNKINNEYFFYRLQEDNFTALAEGSMTGAGGLKRVPHEVVNSFQFYLPTIYEQNEIASFLNSATTKIDTLIQKQLQQIDLLKERRTALISAAVTGKIDLRDWTPPASSSEESFTAEEATA